MKRSFLRLGTRPDARRDRGVATPTRRLAPRVIGRDRRHPLTHLERAGWIGGRHDLLVAWREYAEEFIRSRPLVPHEQRTWLMARGFGKQAGTLYRLPEQAEDYLSDLQARLLPLVNGEDGALLTSRTLFTQVFGEQLPWPEVLGQVLGGRSIPEPRGIRAWQRYNGLRRLCRRPVFAGDGPVSVEPALSPEAGLADAAEASREVQLMGLPACSDWFGACERTRQHRFKLFVIRDPDTGRFGACAACVVVGDCEGRFTAGTISIGLDCVTGQPQSTVLRTDAQVARGLDCPPWGPEKLPTTAAPGWRDFTSQVLATLDGFPMLAWLQIDFDLAVDGYRVLDASDKLDAEAFQVHRPLLGETQCRRFFTEYCL